MARVELWAPSDAGNLSPWKKGPILQTLVFGVILLDYALQSPCATKEVVKTKVMEQTRYDQNAIQALKDNKMGLKRASKTFCVPCSTLQRFSHLDLPIEEVVNRKFGRKTVMSLEMEL
ncbi:hypothetical protein PR048_012491 [Dryococelus australis]|uniref:HTH psq-type domain-containing protein n=1 Tax=Dryococelus australis TaxID=614101 RepID=A0ABQ9HPY2_9NEOP|nr:hypothetical protein PR048_012491 [Dryococelus australis]